MMLLSSLLNIKYHNLKTFQASELLTKACKHSVAHMDTLKDVSIFDAKCFKLLIILNIISNRFNY